jgi:hypothetical protein
MLLAPKIPVVFDRTFEQFIASVLELLSRVGCARFLSHGGDEIIEAAPVKAALFKKPLRLISVPTCVSSQFTHEPPHIAGFSGFLTIPRLGGMEAAEVCC